MALRVLTALIAAAVAGVLSLSAQVVFPGEAWATSTPVAQGLDPVRLDSALAYLAAHAGEDQLHQTAIIKNGYLVYAGDSIDLRHNIYSATKCLTSAALGLLVDDGAVALDSRAADFEPSLSARYPDVELRHFATMTSGYDADGPPRWPDLDDDWSLTPYAVGEPLFAPGTAYAYWDEAQMMYGHVLARAAGRDLYNLLDERLMAPIGVSAWDWWHEDSLALDSGALVPRRNGCTGIDISARDLARVGWLFANYGVWSGDTLVAPEFVRSAISAQVPADLPVAATERADVAGPGVYGYNWWTASPEGGGAHAMTHSPADAAYMSGLHQNVCMVVPSERLVIVRMGEDGNPPEGKWRVWDEVLRRLL